MPRVLCERHKVKQVGAPWAENRSRFTMRFEALVIDWLREASIAAVAHQMELSWDEVDGIMQRAVQRGLEEGDSVLTVTPMEDETDEGRAETIVIGGQVGKDGGCTRGDGNGVIGAVLELRDNDEAS